MADENITMDFNTMLTTEIPAGNTMMGHPSMFQTPQMDKRIDDNTDMIKVIDPADVWANRVSFGATGNNNMASQYTVPFDPKDPPLTKAEIGNIMSRINLVVDRNTSNTVPSMLWNFFFSRENVATLQNNIRFAVNRWSGHHIGTQSTTELVIIMGTIYNKRCRNIDEANAPSKMVFRHISTEVGRLNELVVNEAVPIIINALEQHVAYLKKVDNPMSATSLARPIDTKITGVKDYRAPTDVLF